MGAFAYESNTQIARTYVFRLCFRGQCSVPNTRTLVGNTFDYGPFAAWDLREPCPFAQPFCDDPDLMAYADYDTPGDVTLHTRWKDVPPNGWNPPNPTKYPQYDIAAGTFSSLYQDTDYTDEQKLSMGALQYFPKNSWFSLLPSGGGIFIGSGSQLQYDVSSLGLGDRYAVEMRVRGNALKRSVGMNALLDSVGGFRLMTMGGILQEKSKLNERSAIGLSSHPITNQWYTVSTDNVSAPFLSVTSDTQLTPISAIAPPVYLPG